VSLKSFLNQKGFDPTQQTEVVRQLTTLWTHLRAVSEHLCGLEEAFTGAGGGLVLGLHAVFPQLKRELGARKVAQANALGPSLQSSDVAVCGEGCLDESTLYGKAGKVVAEVAHEHHARVFGVFGRIEGENSAWASSLGLEKTYRLFEGEKSKALSEIAKISRQRFHEIGAQIAHDIEASHLKHNR
jgi:glycerate 2-kinase